MAKLTKDGVIELARKMAREDAAVQAQTLEQIQAATYEDRKHIAQALAAQATAARGMDIGDVPERYTGLLMETFASYAMGTWDSKVRDLENARKRFRRACEGLSTDEAVAKIKALVNSFGLRGMRPLDGEYSGDGVTVAVNRAWGAEASLYICLRRDENVTTNPDDEKQRAGAYHVEIELSWAGTSRSLAVAIAAATLYQELIAIAAEVEAVMRGVNVVYTWGFERQEKKAVADGQ